MNGGGTAFTGRASISESLRTRIRQKDALLELHDLGPAGVHAYRVKTYGGAPSEDFLIWQFRLKYEPGEWIMECLNECDVWSRHGSIERATRKSLESYEDFGDVAERDALLKVSEISEAMAPDLIRKIERKRVMASVKQGKVSLR